jgi:FkbM family methyltransferase
MNRLTGSLINFYLKLPFRPFKETLIRLYGALRSISKNRVVIATVEGITYELDLNEVIDSEIYFTGSYEPYVTEAINKLCREGFVVLDIGANIGAHTFRFAKIAGPKGKVIAFEPMSWAFTKLKRNMELNDFGNVILEKVALSNRNINNQEIGFVCSWPVKALDGARLHPVHRAPIMKDTASFITLDDYLKKKGVGKIDLIKLDVDGYELKVIQGMIETLRLYKPLIIMELSTYTLGEVGDDIKDLISLLKDIGYKFYSGKKMKVFPDTGSLLNSIPSTGLINVILSTTDLKSV